MIEPSHDQRNIQAGRVIPSQTYADQPYVVVLGDGSWLCVLTTGAGEEGDAGQHVVAIRSVDQGRNWGEPIDIEPPDGPEASWAVPLCVPNLNGPLGRVYVFYVYNRDNLREVIAPDEYSRHRVDTLGYYVFRFSDDGGQSWSEDRFEVRVREFAIDRENPYGGRVRFFWSVCKPLIHAGKAFLAVHKVGRFGEGFMARSEGAFLVSNNILCEPDPSKIRWQTLPDGDIGLRALEKLVADEQNLTALSDGTLFCTYRTVEGHPCHAYSRDGGHSWTPPAHMTYGPGCRKVKHPRAANFVRRFANGNYLYWFHNHGLQWYAGRNPVWLIGGREVATAEGRQIQWSQPEIALYDDDLESRISYPDFIEQGEQIFLTETQKLTARSHEISPRSLEWLWQDSGNAPGDASGDASGDAPVAVAALSGPGLLEMPRLPSLWRDRGGFTLEMRARFENAATHQILFDSRDEAGNGITLSLTERATVKLSVRGGLASHNTQGRHSEAESSWECDAGLLGDGAWHWITAIVDGGPKLILWVIDGVLNDGGESRPFGWGRFHGHLDDVNGAPRARVAALVQGQISQVRLYNRALLVNEAAANQQAEP